MCVCVCVCVCVYVCVCMCTCVRACVCMHACVCAWNGEKTFSLGYLQIFSLTTDISHLCVVKCIPLKFIFAVNCKRWCARGTLNKAHSKCTLLLVALFFLCRYKCMHSTRERAGKSLGTKLHECGVTPHVQRE